jgi:hypothetical protein
MRIVVPPIRDHLRRISPGLAFVVVFAAGFGLGRTTAPEPELAPAVPPSVASPPIADTLDAPEDPAPAAMPDDPWAGLGQSVGTPRNGWLVDGLRLEAGPGYALRHPERTWATAGTIEHLLHTIERVRAAHPRLHRLAIGDLSARTGGWLQGHVSHRSGRDVDLGFYYRVVPEGYPDAFVVGTRDNLDVPALWTLVRTLAATHDAADGVQWILLDQRIQRLLHRHALRHGVDATELASILQYPRAPELEEGIVRHFPAHDDHIHVRFKCPPADAHCSDPVDTPGGPLRAYARVK